MQHNPNAPALIGEEWRPAVPNTLPTYRVDSLAGVVAMRLDSTVTQTVDELGVFLGTDTATGRFIAELLVAGSEVVDPFDTQITTLRPTSVGGPGSASDWPHFPGPDGFDVSLVDEVVLDTSDYNDCAIDVDAFAAMRFDTAGVFTGRKIVKVQLTAVAAIIFGPGGDLPNTNSYLRGRQYNNTTPGVIWKSYTPASTAKPGFGEYQTRTFDAGEINPDTAQPWTVADIEAWDTGSGSNMRVGFDTRGGSLAGQHYGVRIFQVFLQITHVAENRLTGNVVTTSATGNRWWRFTPRKVDAAANFAKVNGNDFTLVLRQPRYGDAVPSGIVGDYKFSVPYIEGSNATPPPGLVQWPRVGVSADGTIFDLGDPAGNRTVGLDLRISGTGSVDAQPYITVSPVATGDSPGTIQQEVSGAAAATYAGVIFPARVVDAGSNFTLTVRLKRRSDNAVMATATIDRDTALLTPAGDGSWRVLQVDFAATAFLAAATQYYLDFSQTGSPGGFILAAFNTTTGSPGTAPSGIATYDGTTDVATFGGGDVSTADIAVVVYETFDPPTAFAAAPGSVLVDTEDDCGLAGIGYAHLTWNPFVSGTGFAYYEIQRSDPLTDWATIGRVTDYTRGSWFDLEGRLGVQSCYRIRGVPTTDITSTWSPTVCATAPVAGCGYTFTSNLLNNAGTGPMVGYADTTRSADFVDRDIQFPEAGEVKRVPIYGRPMYVSFIPAERRGDEFTRRLNLGALSAGSGPPPDDADALRDLSRYPGLPYVCVRDESGQRWFANVAVSDYVGTNPGGFQHVTVAVGERLAVPTPVESP